MYSKAWITNASAAVAVIGSLLAGFSGEMTTAQAAQGAIAGAAVFGLGRKLEAARQILIQIGTVAAAVQVPDSPAATAKQSTTDGRTGARPFST